MPKCAGFHKVWFPSASTFSVWRLSSLEWFLKLLGDNSFNLFTQKLSFIKKPCLDQVTCWLEEIAIIPHWPTKRKTISRPGNIIHNQNLRSKTAIIIYGLLDFGLNVPQTRSIRLDHHSCTKLNMELFHFCSSWLPGIDKCKLHLSDSRKDKLKFDKTSASLCLHTFSMTRYRGVMTFRRKASSSPP